MSFEDDERLERFAEAMAYATRREEAEILAAATECLAQVSTADVPPPLSWHPYYRGKTWLIDWLNGDSSLPEWEILIPLPEPVLREELGTYPIEPVSLRCLRMSKQRATGLAPWVGRPFFYGWFVGTDDLGRSIAGESRIVYED